MPRDPMQLDRDVTVPRRVIPEGTTRHGLVIGIDKYADTRLNLRCAVADARLLRDLMIDPECGCFPPDNVQLVTDAEATQDGVFRALARLRRQAAENDMIWIFYAGHAAIDDDSYWVTHDADVDDLFGTALSSERIHSALSKLPTKRVVRILDCCHAEATALMTNPTRHVATTNELFDRFEGHGIITLAASNGTQRSVELSDLGHGAFTYFLAKGLRGEADVDGDGVVTADELWSYLRGKVKEAASRAGNPQMPMLIGSMTHDVALTLNSAATAKRRRLMSEIEQLVGLRPDQITTDEGKLCAEILVSGPRTHLERQLMDSLEELAEGKLTRVQFRRWLQAVVSLRVAASARAAAEAERASAEAKARVRAQRARDDAYYDELHHEQAPTEPDLPVQEALGLPRYNTKFIVLLLAPSADDANRLALESEVIERELDRSNHRGGFELHMLCAADPIELLRKINQTRPTIVHFSGFGFTDAMEPQLALYLRIVEAVALPDDRQEPAWTDALEQTIGAVRSSLKSSVPVVVLSGCYHERAVEEYLTRVDCVVGTGRTMTDDAVASFAASFYRGLANGHSVAAAFRQGCKAVGITGVREGDSPQLRVRAGVNPEEIILAWPRHQ